MDGFELSPSGLQPDRFIGAAVIFDLDGTLTRPLLDFDAIRAEIGVAGPILEAMEHLNADDRARADEILLRHERLAAENAQLQEGTHEVLRACRDLGYRVAILTRNSRANVEHIIRTHHLRIDALRTREDGAIKPSPEPVLALCRELKADPALSWMVGDFLFDIQSGRAAGTKTVLMIGDDEVPPFANQADHVIRRLAELTKLLSSR
jgi:HAD superfamily hydrolase (TIGR01662 family)